MPAPRLDLDPDRCWAAGVPDQVGFATKPVLATKMITRALDADVPAAWVTGDVVYGADPGLRAELEGRGVGYVLAVACDHPVLAAGDSYRADALLRRVPVRAWQCVSAGASKATACTTGVVRLDDRAAHPDSQAGQHWLLARRNRTTGELAFYRCWTPPPVAWLPWPMSPAPLEDRGALLDRQGPGRPGLPSGAPLAILVSVGTLAMLAPPSWWWRLLPNGPASRHRPGWCR